METPLKTVPLREGDILLYRQACSLLIAGQVKQDI